MTECSKLISESTWFSISMKASGPSVSMSRWSDLSQDCWMSRSASTKSMQRIFASTIPNVDLPAPGMPMSTTLSRPGSKDFSFMGLPFL